MFEIGDSVAVKPGVKDPDFGIEIGGWQGRIIQEPDAKNRVMIAWDSVTLRAMPEESIVQSEEQGLDWTQTGLEAQEIVLAEPRDSEQDVALAVNELTARYAWSWLGEQGRRIQQVLAGEDDDVDGLYAWEEYLSEHLTFPFEAVVDEFQERGPLQAGDRLKVTGIGLVDDLYGVVVDVRLGRRKYAISLCDLEVVDRDSPNYQIVHDYSVWFANQ